MMTTEPKPVETKDKWTIYALLTLEHIPLRINTIENANGYRIKVYEFEETAHTDYENWVRGSKEGDMAVIRKVKSAEDLFIDNLHR